MVLIRDTKLLNAYLTINAFKNKKVFIHLNLIKTLKLIN